MKLRNRKTGEIIETDFELSVSIPDDEKLYGCDTYNQIKGYSSIAELNEEWEDYEEPKGSALDLMILTLVNFIENEPDEDKVDLEDCKNMVETLKAWKRIRDKGFKFDGRKNNEEKYLGDFVIYAHIKDLTDIVDDLDLLFGGKE